MGRWILSFLVGISLVLALWFGWYLITPVSDTAETVSVVIPRETGLAGIAEILKDRGLIADDLRFRILAAVSGKGRRLRAGEYAVPPGLTPPELLSLLASGKVSYRRVTIPEGMDREQIAAILAREGWVDQERFLALTRDPDFIARLGLEVIDLEGYLFPDTYKLSRGQQDEESIIEMMVARNRQVLADLVQLYPEAPLSSEHEILTLAAIVEKETGRAGERPLIARVFLNRLKRGMRLQADPTVCYGIPECQGRRLTYRDLERSTPYNTYVIKGLPPGPIASPGRAAIAAVLNPADASYLYFVSKNDGTHHFSTTLAEHNRAVARYQKGR